MDPNCPHDRIKVTRLEDGWEWACALCPDVIATWSSAVFEKIVGDDYHEVAVGDSFIFKVVVKEEDENTSI
jgi:hypothetical protein